MMKKKKKKEKGFLLCSVWISAELSDGCSSINLHVMVLTLEPRSHPSLSCYFHYLSLLSFTAGERPCVCVCVERPGGQGCGACLSFLIFNQLLAITLVLVQCYVFSDKLLAVPTTSKKKLRGNFSFWLTLVSAG